MFPFQESDLVEDNLKRPWAEWRFKGVATSGELQALRFSMGYTWKTLENHKDYCTMAAIPFSSPEAKSSADIEAPPLGTAPFLMDHGIS
jgi:hypothetical protein